MRKYFPRAADKIARSAAADVDVNNGTALGDPGMAEGGATLATKIIPQVVPKIREKIDVEPYLKLMVEKSASDLFFTTTSPVKIKIEGDINSVGSKALTPERCAHIAWSIMSEEQYKRFHATRECDFAIPMRSGEARFRVNAFWQRGTVGLVLRRIPSQIPTVDELGLPTVLKDMAMNKRGLVLMVGATGSGKSTSLAAMLNHRNHYDTGHIVTIEDPIEFSHPNKKSIINQREVGVDTDSYHNALKSAMREAPDVLLVGEIRERETMEIALELCNTGHLVLSTLHANNANQAIERVINMFPQELHKQVFMDLSLNVRSIVSQRLVKGISGNRHAAIEILINTPHIADLMMQGKLDELKSAMRDSGAQGMQTFDKALLNIYNAGKITLDEALANADSRADLEAEINFG